MATTSRWGAPYPVKDDPPEGWLQIQSLAEFLDDELGHALELADAAERTALGTAIGSGGRGLIVLQVDTAQPYMWLGASWLALAAAAGGGGGGAGSRGRWRQTGTAQPIPNAADTVVRFDSDGLTTPDITKITSGAGHGFRMERAGVLTGTANVRYATTTATGVRHAHVVIGDNADYLASGGGGEAGQPVPINLGFGPVDVAEDDVISVRCFQSTGAPRNLEPVSGAARWVHLEMELR